MDHGQEFMGEVIDLLKESGIVQKVITMRNPQANAMVECPSNNSQHDMHTKLAKQGRPARMHATIHMTNHASPTQLVFGCNHFLNVNFEADWQYIKHCKQCMIVQNNKHKNAKRTPHQYNIGDKVLVQADPSCKHGEDKYLPVPHMVTHVYDNNTLWLRHETP
jgi:hypothetical protein